MLPRFLAGLLEGSKHHPVVVQLQPAKGLLKEIESIVGMLESLQETIQHPGIAIRQGCQAIVLSTFHFQQLLVMVQ